MLIIPLFDKGYSSIILRPNSKLLRMDGDIVAVIDSAISKLSELQYGAE